jgi:signal transduction histidine kinase
MILVVERYRRLWAMAPTAIQFPTRLAREAGLLLLVAVATYITAGSLIGNGWVPLEAAAYDARWQWVPVAGALVATLLRLWSPAVAVIGAAALFGWWPASGVALAIGAFEVAGALSVRRRIAVLALAAAIGFGVGLQSTDLPVVTVIAFHAVTVLVCLALPAWARTALGRADRVVRALRERTGYLEENYRLAHSAARLQERSRIAQEMHDQLGHRLSLITMYAGALELRAADAGSGQAKLIRGTAQTAMSELRDTLGLLRSGDSEDMPLRPLGTGGLRSDIERLVSESRAAGVDVTLNWQGADLNEVAASIRNATHRIIREALTNVHRHAAGAAATIDVNHDRDLVRLRIVNGSGALSPGLVPAGTGLGLIGVRDRVLLLGGDFTSGQLRGGGFQVAAELPRHPPRRGAPPPAVLPPVGRPEQGSDRWTRYGSATILTAGLVGVTALVIVAIIYVPLYATDSQVQTETPPPATVLHVGMPRAEAEPEIGPDDPVARLAAPSVWSVPPTGSSCSYHTDWTPDQVVSIVRYCFRADVLSSIDRFVVARDVSVVGP